MKLEKRPVDQIIIPYPAKDPAPWTRHSRFAVGRARKTGFVELAIGTGAVAHGLRIGTHVSLALLDLTDGEMRQLAAAEEQAAALPYVAAAMGFLVDRKLGVLHAGEVFGLKDKSEATRLNQISRLPRDVLRVIEAKRLTRNHVRWVLGLPLEVALHGLSTHKGVKALRNWRRGLTAPTSVATAAPEAQPGTDASLDAESERISGVLGAHARVEQGDRGGWRLVVRYSTAETLAGVFERLGEGYGEAPGMPKGAAGRTVVVEGLTTEELEYLTGRSD